MRRRLRKANDPNKASASLRGRIPMTALVQTLAVAEYLSFHRATRALGTSQSSVSAHVKALEDDLPDLYWWQQWDACLRLRLGTANAYVNADLDPKSFRRITSDGSLFNRLVELADETKQGRRFLKRVAA
jgi:hypothetical protein